MKTLKKSLFSVLILLMSLNIHAKIIDENALTTLRKNFIQLGGDSIALDQALCFYNKHQNTTFEAKDDNSKLLGISFKEAKYILIFDMNKSSKIPRLFVLNLDTGEVEVTSTTHGRGRDKQEIINSEYAKILSNTPDTFLSSRGFFITGEKYATTSEYWSYGMHIYGLETDINDNAYKREIIVHPYSKVVSDLYSSSKYQVLPKLSMGKLQVLSWGCLMLNPKVAQTIINKVRMEAGETRGQLLYNYSDYERKQGALYCGGEKLQVRQE